MLAPGGDSPGYQLIIAWASSGEGSAACYGVPSGTSILDPPKPGVFLHRGPMSTDATIPEQDIRELIRQPEGLTLEFKSHTPDSAVISQVLGAFANTDGGTLIVGVREGGEVVGVDVRRLLCVVEQVRGRLIPPQEIRLDAPSINGKQIGIVRIGKSEAAPVFAEGGVFVRRGARVRPMTGEDLTRRLQQASEQFTEAALADAIARQTLLIETLRLDLRKANCWQSKMKDYVIGGIIGAILGALASLVIK